jgi:quercetin dioxygenase-like cupin family protein
MGGGSGGDSEPVMYEIVNFQASVALEPKRDQIFALERRILECEPAVMPLRHFFADGLYGRELTIPKHCVLTGAIHKRQHINILLKGDITVVTDGEPVRIQAPYVMVSEPGTKRAGFAHEDSVWLTVHACEATDVAAAEDELATNDPQEYERFIEEQQCQWRLPAQS